MVKLSAFIIGSFQMANREVYKLRTTGSEAVYCFYTIGQCHPHPVAKRYVHL